MAPPKLVKANNAVGNTRTTRSQLKSSDVVTEPTNIHGKRKGDENEEKPSKRARPVLGNITNATHETEIRKIGLRNNATIVKPDASRPALRSIANVNADLVDTKKKVVTIPTTDQTNNQKDVVNSIPQQPLRMPKVMTRAAARAKAHVHENKTTMKPVGAINKRLSSRRLSNDFDNTEDSLYLSAHEDLSTSKLRLSLNDLTKRSSLASDADSTTNSMFTTISAQDDLVTKSKPPAGVIDFDELTPNDPIEVSEYTMDIFNYLKEREKFYPIRPYLDIQVHLTKWMRMLVVDWMVEVQEAFELNHETLYLAVKIIDVYLGVKVIVKDKLQLLGAAAMLIASKFDERTPPLIEDFHYICDGVYSNEEFVAMEIDVFKTIKYDLGFPLSYRFVRRYARCGHISLRILTLARYILEYNLMDYDSITLSDSKKASAALFIALCMVGKPGWNTTLEYYSGYKFTDFKDIVIVLNSGLRKQKDNVKIVRNKYSHKLFHEVAKIPLLSNEQLFEGSEVYIQQTSNANC